MTSQGPSLADLGAQALKLLDDLLGKTAGDDSFNVRAVELDIQAQQFQLWTNNLDIFHAAHGSLDYRLRDAPSISSLARELLEELIRCLNHCMSHLSP